VITRQTISSPQELELFPHTGTSIYRGGDTIKLRTIFGEPFGTVCQAPRLVQSDMLRRADDVFPLIQKIPSKEWHSIFINAGIELEEMIVTSSPLFMDVCNGIMLLTGLPLTRVIQGFKAIASYLKDVENILAAQLPASGNKTHHAYFHEATHLAVKLPGNYPSVNINWLLALALRRPVVLNTSLRDPLSAQFLAQLLYKHGLPDHTLSIAPGAANYLFKNARQVLWAGAPGDQAFYPGASIKKYHQGQSKLLLEKDPGNITDFWKRLRKLITWASGRVCTNVSTVLVYENEHGIAKRLATELSHCTIEPLDHPAAIVPAFQHREEALEIAERIGQAIREGAIDYSQKVTGDPLIQYLGGAVVLRPTVLLADVSNSIYGQEFPFPFVTVSKIDNQHLYGALKNSLITSVIGGNKDTLEFLSREKTIDKVFYNEAFDRGFNPLDTHEGFITDFLLGKKTIIANS
jgi:thienamycin biosynthesis protein ThnO